MAEAPDAVIIGSGHNSLACAAHLAARGWKVAIYERAPTPGGAIKTGEYTLPGFRHDWAAMNLSLFAGSKFHQKYADELAEHGLRFVAAKDCFASVFPDARWLGISTDATVNAARIGGQSLADRRAWGRLTEHFGADADALVALLSCPMKKFAFANFVVRTWRQRGTRGGMDLVRFLTSSSRVWLDETFQSPKVKALLAAWGMHLDFSPDVAGGAMFPYLEGQANQAFGMVLGQGGADTLTRALVAMIEARGGTVTCDAEAARILHADGRATGVELADGTIVEARKAVIANVAPKAMLRLTGGTGQTRYDRGLETYAHAPGTMMIHLAMSDLPDWTAGAELRRFAYVHLAPDMDQMAATYAQAQAGLLPSEPVIVCGQPTATDPTRAPDGQHVLWLQVRMVPGTIKGDAMGVIASRDWQTAAEPMAQRALDLLERYAPGARAKILDRHIVTPAQLEADNPNLVGGDQLCGSHHISQHFMFRPMRGHADGTTPIRDLYHTGAAVWPGAGTGAGSGYLLGQKLAGA